MTRDELARDVSTALVAPLDRAGIPRSVVTVTFDPLDTPGRHKMVLALNVDLPYEVELDEDELDEDEAELLRKIAESKAVEEELRQRIVRLRRTKAAIDEWSRRRIAKGRDKA